jgi:hypothetical protein
VAPQAGVEPRVFAAVLAGLEDVIIVVVKKDEAVTITGFAKVPTTQ